MSRRWRWLAAPVALLAAVGASQWEALSFSSVVPEDFVMMFSGSIPPSAKDWLKLFTSGYYRTFHSSALYRPLKSVAYRLGWLLFGGDIFVYQCAKALLLWATALLVFVLGARLLKDRRAAFVAALLYAAHPLHAGTMQTLGKVEDLSVAFFCLLALWAHARLLERKGPWTGALLLVGCAYALALMSKETAVVLPALVLFHDWAFPVSAAERGRLGTRMRAERAVFLLLTAGYIALILGAGAQLYGRLALGSEPLLSGPGARLARYLTALFTPLVDGDRAPARLPWVLGLAGMAAAEAVAGRRRAALFYGGWIVLGLLPVLNLVSTSNTGWYLSKQSLPLWRLALPAIGFCWLIGAVLARMCALPWGRPAAALLAAGMFLLDVKTARAAALASRASCAEPRIDWPSLLSGYDYRDSPFFGLALTLPQIRRVEPERYARLEAAIAGLLERPQSPTVLDIFSTDAIYGDTEAYIRTLEALSHKGFVGFHRELGRIEDARTAVLEGCGLLASGEPAKARRRLQSALKSYPGYLSSLLEEPRKRLARPDWRGALRAACSRADARGAGEWFAARLGEASRLKDDGVDEFRAGERSRALEMFERSAALNGDDVYALVSLAAARMALGRNAEALAPLNHALTLQSVEGSLRASVLGERAQALEALGRRGEAERDRLTAAKLAAAEVKQWR